MGAGLGGMESGRVSSTRVSIACCMNGVSDFSVPANHTGENKNSLQSKRVDGCVLS